MVIFDFAFATLSGKLNHISYGNRELVWVYLVLDIRCLLASMSAFDRGNILQLLLDQNSAESRGSVHSGSLNKRFASLSLVTQRKLETLYLITEHLPVKHIDWLH